MFSDLQVLKGLFPQINNTSPFEGLPYNVHQSAGVMKAQWSFASQGGAIGTISLLDDLGNAAILPKGTIITQVLCDFLTAATSGGSATISLGANTTTDLLNAEAVASATGLVAGTPVGTAATSVKLTAQRQITLTVATAALTAGVANFFIYFVYSN